MFEQFIESFNEPQRAAIEYCDGPSLVVAGAGSGKTRVLTYKIAYLLEQGYEPWSILALTFTNKAANEMKARIARIVGEERARYLWMGTFHSVFLRILRMEHERIPGLREDDRPFTGNFTIYDASDSKSLVKAIIKEMELDDKMYRPGTVAGRISEAKNALKDPAEYARDGYCVQRDMNAKIPAMSQIYRRYCDRCRNADAMDFDDILLYTFRLFEACPDVLAKYEERFRYVLVDEYQDTNYAQHRIVQQLTAHNQHVCVVGDDAQSIYSFRGANIDNILKFQELYPGTRLFKLEQNYRSTQTIVNAANSLIHKNAGQIYKNVFSKLDIGEPLPVIEAYSDVEEAQFVIRKIMELHQREGLEYSDFAILYRTNAQSRLFEENLMKQGLPYRVYGGVSFYQRKEIKDIIAYFRLAVNPHDEEALKRIINYPVRGIGATTLAKVVEVATAHSVSLWEVLVEPGRYQLNVSKGTYTKLAEFTQLISMFMTKAIEENADVAGQYIIKESGVMRDIYADTTPENLSRQENVEELVNGLQDFVAGRMEEGNQNVSIGDYLAEVSLLSDMDTDKGGDESKVTLMTIHSAKGLEFPTVFVVGLEENLFPNQMSASSPREIEEERRLFYVAITRAQRHCLITYAKSRFRFGKMEFSVPSRFLSDIDPQYVRFTGGSMSRSSNEVELPWMRRRPTTDSWRPQPVQSSRPTYQPKPFVPQPPTHFTRVQISSKSSAASAQGPNFNIQVGQRIQHERFGIGEVLKVEGRGDNMKATVQFQNAGTKQLLLKFARFTVI
ncbi:MAG: UvrD-helicase domain-containing protein [Bacteroidaceae bacterium]|nr:UvrD-helicase domain-containing protein [Bacteroidaceae bacterium]